MLLSECLDLIRSEAIVMLVDASESGRARCMMWWVRGERKEWKAADEFIYARGGRSSASET